MNESSFAAIIIESRLEEQDIADHLAEEGLDDPSLRMTMRDYYAACLEETPKVCSIAVADATGPVLLMPMVFLDRRISYFGMPGAPVFAKRLNDTARREAFSAACSMAIDHCMQASIGFTISRSLSRTQDDHRLSNWEVKLLQNGGRQVTHYRGYVALDGGEVGIRRQMRKSYRSLINWGRREMQLSFVDSANADAELFNRFRLFHLRVAGRCTRPLASWIAMFDLIQRRRAILGLGYLGKELVAATYLINDGGRARYGTGVYDRDQFDKPISHWPLFATMQRAGEQGAQICDLGEVFPDHRASDKERNIAFFKKGFTDQIVDEAYWQLDSKRTEVSQ